MKNAGENSSASGDGNRKLYQDQLWLNYIHPDTQEWFVIILQIISFLLALTG